MARRKSNGLGTILVLGVFALAAYGGYVLYKKPDVQKNVVKVERVVKAAKGAW
jgi:hypothetical protein